MEKLDMKKLICLLLAALMCGWALADETVRIDHENMVLDGEWVDGATALANGKTMSGVLTKRDEYDYYSFALESESQPYLTIHSESDGQQIAVIYDGDMVEIQTIYDLKTYAANLELAAGTYSIAISGAKGAYTLRCAY